VYAGGRQDYGKLPVEEKVEIEAVIDVNREALLT
jgi:hypothetical protein